MSFSCSTFATKCFLADCLHVIQFCQVCCSWSLHAMNLFLPWFVSQTCQEQGHRVHGTLAKHMGTSELNVNRLTATLFSKFGARLQQATATYKCNQGHGWIEHDMILLNV